MNWIVTMTVAERMAAAKEKTQRVIDHLRYLLALHENNAVVVYSQTLSQQIPTSHAAHAFIVFRQAMHQFEIVRLCALWDSAGSNKENIPTIIDLLDPDVIESLAQEEASHWQGRGVDPERQRIDEQYGQGRAQEARDGLRKAIADSREIVASPKYASIMNLRHKRLAHSLSETWQEQKAGALPPMKYGDEREMLDETLPIVEALHRWVNGSDFSLENSRRIDRKNAKALWEACMFNITR